MLTGDNGILTQANNSKIQQAHGAVREGISLAYNEYQIEINTASNTKLASTEKVTIKGEEEKALANTSMTFLDFLKGGNEQKINYIKDGTENVLDVETLTGSKQALGNGADTDIYKIEEGYDTYVVNYYDINNKQEIWSIQKNILESDTGKEALILVYNISAGDTIELPYDLRWYDSEYNRYDATFDFDVDWGDGNTTESITNDSIELKATHRYEETGEKRVTITGSYEVLSGGTRLGTSTRKKLIRVEQWGTTGLKEIELDYFENLTEIATPTENSFKDLVSINFSNSPLKSIPERLFTNCPNVTSFSYTFSNTNITSIPENLFVNCPNVTNFTETFRGTAITSLPENLFAHVDWDKVEYLSKCFTGCRNLRGKAPELWLEGTNSKENDYQGKPDGFACFTDCTNLDKNINYKKYILVLVKLGFNLALRMNMLFSFY